ncbi:sucrase ferredoxin [Nocardioides bigeumensis]|uniref:Sucrase ferredoxin n=1 Tax=Nocardioides bigeumensis TaxID=433657 RepID=A0ABN2YXX7_9ACTN
MTQAPAWRCAADSLSRGDDLAGTASTVAAYLLLEHAGSWGEDAFRDSRLPAALGPALKRHATSAGVRPLLVRRSGRGRATQGGVRVLAASATHGWAETAVLPDLEAVLDLDLTRLRAGESLGLERVEGPVYAVCTHGRHDACCAERGRPVALALSEVEPERTWECSHIGGDRFAGNLVVLPHGLYYGRLDPESAVAVAAATAEGRLDLDHLRGRSTRAMPVQAAEIHLRRLLEEDRFDAVTLRGRPERHGDTVTAGFAVAGAAGDAVYAVAVRTTFATAPAALTCQAGRGGRTDQVPRHEVVDITRVDPRTSS